MDKVSVTLHVFFEEPFWIGVVERTADGKLEAARITFGAEPRDYEVQSFLLLNQYRLRFSPAVEAAVKYLCRNPKRMLREVHKQIQETGIGTRSQRALKLQQEEAKTVRRLSARDKRKADKMRKFEQKQQKKKEKHRGR